MSGGVTAVLQSMLRNTEERENRFARALRDQVARVDADAGSIVAEGPEAGDLSNVDGVIDRASDPEVLAPATARAPEEGVAGLERGLAGGMDTAVAEPDPSTASEHRRRAQVPHVRPATTFIDLASPASSDLAPPTIEHGSAAKTPRPGPAQPASPEPAPARFAPALKLPEQRTDVAFGDFGQLGRPRWSRDRMADIGMPRGLLEALAALDPQADLKWMEVLVRAAAAPCATVPEESAMLISGSHTRLADVLGLPIHRPGDLPPYGGSIYCLLPPAPTPGDIQWLRRVQGDRGTHVVLEDERSQELIGDDVTTVSYASELGAALALKWSLTEGFSLAFGVTQSGEPIRATAFDVALAVRTWMRSE
jgi:hypothetical protein